MSGIDDLLRGARINEARPVQLKKQTTLLNAGVGIEETENGYALHFDLLLSDTTGERVTIPFDMAGWERFKNNVNAVSAGIEVASVSPIKPTDASGKLH